MIYKYFSLERRDVLENLLIRFTQPGDFNDPFELHPSFDLMSKADIAALPEAPGHENTQRTKAKVLTPEVLQQMFSVLMPGIQRTMAETVQDEGTYSLNNNKIARSVFDSKYGILCLTKDPDNLLMWAHYANNHNGFVLQFDEEHPFFAPYYFDQQEFLLTQVEYTNNRPVLSYSTLHSQFVYYRKSPCWSYENEWRLIRPLSDAKKIIEHSIYPRALFQIPADAIKGIIIGVSVTHPDRIELLNLLKRVDLEHIAIFQTRLSDESYTLEIHPPLNGKYPPDALSGKICESR
jgi:Protein of unknown function (DUF2971)